MSLDIDIDAAIKHLHQLPDEEKAQVLTLFEKRERLKKIEAAQGELYRFC